MSSQPPVISLIVMALRQNVSGKSRKCQGISFSKLCGNPFSPRFLTVHECKNLVIFHYHAMGYWVRFLPNIQSDPSNFFFSFLDVCSSEADPAIMQHRITSIYTHAN